MAICWLGFERKRPAGLDSAIRREEHPHDGVRRRGRISSTCRSWRQDFDRVVEPPVTVVVNDNVERSITVRRPFEHAATARFVILGDQRIGRIIEENRRDYLAEPRGANYNQFIRTYVDDRRTRDAIRRQR